MFFLLQKVFTVARKSPVQNYIVTTDQVQQWSGQAVDWIQKRYKLFAVIAGGVILVVGGLLGGQAWKQRRAQQAAALLAEATQQIQATPRTDRMTYSQETLTALQTVVDSYPNTSAAIQAHWYLGHLYLERGDYPAAQTAYEKAVEIAGDDKKRFLPTLVHLNLAYAKEANNACGDAIADFTTVINSPTVWLHGEAYLGIGRCQERMEEFEKAMATYEKAQASSVLDEATRRSVEERLLALRSSHQTGTPSESKSPSKP